MITSKAGCVSPETMPVFLMKVHDIIPYSIEKNLGKAYNDAMELIPDGDTVCFRDGDTCWLTPDYGMILHEYATRYPDAVLTCWTNRIHKSSGQLDLSAPSTNDMVDHTRYALSLSVQKDATNLQTTISGFCLVIPKHIWQQHKFAEEQPYEDRKGVPNMLGVDNDWTNRIRAAGIPVLRMDGLYLYHNYRLLTNSKDHLL